MVELISVLMPTYNAASWVTHTIDNLASQTYTHYELIVVDDGSNDDTVAVIRAKLANDFRQPWQIIELGSNRGPSAARNVGLKAAKGSWIQALDSDDLIAPIKFELQMGHCGRASAEVSSVYSPWRQCYIDGAEVEFIGQLSRPDMDGRAPIMCLVGNDRPLQGAGLTRRSILEQIGGWDESLRFWEVEEVTFRTAEAGRLECVPSATPLYFWRQHRNKPYLGDTEARYRMTPVALSWIDLILKGLRYKTLDEVGLSTRDRQELLGHSSYLARQLYQSDRKAFREYLRKARTLDPDLAPAYPAIITAMSRHIGYEAAETIVDLSRIPRDIMRRILPGKAEGR